jgi:integrase/recombinase XerD
MKKISMLNKDDMTVQEGFDKLIRIKKAKNLSPDTISHYQVQFRYFAEFFNVALPCSEITSDTYYEYIEYLKETRNINAITMNSYLGTVRSILYYFMEEGYMNKFPIKLLKAEKKIKETYTDNELEIILKKPNLKTC